MTTSLYLAFIHAFRTDALPLDGMGTVDGVRAWIDKGRLDAVWTLDVRTLMGMVALSVVRTVMVIGGFFHA